MYFVLCIRHIQVKIIWWLQIWIHYTYITHTYVHLSLMLRLSCQLMPLATLVLSRVVTLACTAANNMTTKSNTIHVHTYIHTYIHVIDSNNVECLVYWYVNDKDMILAIRQRYVGQKRSKQVRDQRNSA